MDPKLARLLTRAGLSRMNQWIWFRDCALEKSIILAPNAELAASLARCWLPQIQTVLADATVRVGQPKAEPSKVAYRGQVTPPKPGELW